MLKKPVNMLLYLAACTTLFFYMPKIIAAIGSARNAPDKMGTTSIDQNAYYSLREVAGIQLGHIIISYTWDDSTGLCQPRFQRDACSSLDSDLERLKKQQNQLQDDLHQQILLIQPYADTDNSGYVDKEEGAQFRDLYEFDHLITHGLNEDQRKLPAMAQATGKTEAEVSEILKKLTTFQAGE